LHKKGKKQVSAKKNVPNKKGDVGMWVGSHPKSYVAPKLFTALAEALEWIVRKRGLSWLLKYIDDFLTVGKARTNECSHNLQVFKDMCAKNS
jgi:hypothetical protein